MAALARRARRALPMTGSSRELDTLTETFNALMASVAAAEAQTQAAYTGAIRALAAALDARDPYTAGHSERVSVLSVAIGRSSRCRPTTSKSSGSARCCTTSARSACPTTCCGSPGALTAAEFDVIKQHPVLGARILRSVPFLAPHIPIVELHHERPDGRGYPYGLRGDDIPLAARIVHVADAYDAMTSARAYRAARPSGDALARTVALRRHRIPRGDRRGPGQRAARRDDRSRTCCARTSHRRTLNAELAELAENRFSLRALRSRR